MSNKKHCPYPGYGNVLLMPAGSLRDAQDKLWAEFEHRAKRIAERLDYDVFFRRQVAESVLALSVACMEITIKGEVKFYFIGASYDDILADARKMLSPMLSPNEFGRHREITLAELRSLSRITGDLEGAIDSVIFGESKSYCLGVINPT